MAVVTGTVDGLSGAEAARRLLAQGRNELVKEAATSPWRLLAQQLKSPLIWLLLGAGALSAGLREVGDAVAIAAIVVLNALVGFAQEYRAERAVLALRAMTAPQARVRRDGRPIALASAEVVVGDLLLLEPGDVVAADARLMEAHSLKLNEAALTGESVPSEKSMDPVAADAPLAERSNAVFMGTAVAAGTGKAEVVAIAMATELGKIAHLLGSARPGATPLQQRLARVSRLLLYLCGAVVVVVALLGLVRGHALLAVFLSAVSLAVAAVPEGLPAIVTIALAVGVRRMAARHVLVRRLPAVETLGCATVICTDKTGTLTTGITTVRELWNPRPDEEHNQDERDDELLAAAAANCDAELGSDGAGGVGGVGGVGDPTELAILMAAAERGIHRAQIERDNPRTTVHPFDSERRMMSILRKDGKLYVKGATEVVLPLCEGSTDNAARQNEALTARGLRVLAVAVGQGADERALKLLGLIGMADPPRPEAIEAVRAATRAGIQTVMITGDHPTTARVIAQELGIVAGDANVADLEARVHARATAADKLAIVRDWKAKGAVVVMTGDGVNDAPALREAQVGICMGKTGTEVTREAADIVLADDNFASIVAGIREGRAIFDNIRKALVYLLAGNVGELGVMLVASIVGLPLPLLPLHLLWINLVTDGLPGLALVVEPTDEHVMERPPRDPAEPILRRTEWTAILAMGAVQTALTLGVFAWTLRSRSLVEARTLAFSVLVFGELFRALSARSPTRLFWEMGPLRNPLLLGVLGLSLAVQLGLQAHPFTRSLFQLSSISLRDQLVVLGLGLVPVTVLELTKLLRRALAPKDSAMTPAATA